MRLQERSYGGKLFRPRPEIFISDDKKIFLLVTPWGPRRMAQLFIEKIQAELQDSTVDPDRTVVALSVDTMSEAENRLRLTLLSIHEDLREEFNNDTLTAGLEVLCLVKDDKKISWFQVGSPFFAILRDSHMLPIHHPLDLSFDHSKEATLPPLPKELLGLSQNINLEHGSFLHRKEDQILMIARSFVAPEVFSLPVTEMTLDRITQILAQDNVDHPFWLGFLDLAI